MGLAEFWAALSPASADDLERFERAFAEIMGASHALAFPYGRTALMLLIEALGLHDKEIIVPAYTCVVVPHAIVYSGNRPVFVDAQEHDFNMDLSKVPRAISPNTGAIIATSLFGYPCDLDQLDAICEETGGRIPVIQDCAHSFGACWRGRRVQKAGVAAIFGLNISKLVTSIFGGMLTTDDDDLYRRLKAIRAERLSPATRRKSLARLAYLLAVYPAFSDLGFSFTNWLQRTGLLNRLTQYYEEGIIDMPSDYLQSMVPVEARVGRENLNRYDDIIRRRSEIADFYIRSLRLPSFSMPPQVEGATYSHFVVRVPDRHAVLERCLRQGVELGQLIEYNIPEMKAYGSRTPDEFRVAAWLSRHTINLPIWGDLRMAEDVVRRVTAACT